MPKPSARDRRVGAICASRSRSRSSGRLGRRPGASASTRAMERARLDRAKRGRAGIFRSSAPARALLQLGELEPTEKLDLVLEPDAEPVESAATSLLHESERVRGCGTVGVLDEV